MAPLLARFLQTPHDHVHSEEKDVGDVLRKVFEKAKVYMQLGSIEHAACLTYYSLGLAMVWWTAIICFRWPFVFRRQTSAVAL